MADSNENDANAANFAELSGHIDLVQRRLKSMKPDTDKYDQSLEDLNDYYERAIQDRSMRITTLEEMCKDQQNETKKAQKEAHNMAMAAIFLTCLFSVVLFPAQLLTAISTVYPYMTTDRIAINLVIAAIVFYASK